MMESRNAVTGEFYRMVEPGNKILFPGITVVVMSTNILISNIDHTCLLFILKHQSTEKVFQYNC